MSTRVRMLLGIGGLLLSLGVFAQQPGPSKRAARPTRPIESPPAPESAIQDMVKAGRSVDAARLLEEQARRDPGNKSIKARVAEVYESQGDLAAAKLAASEAAAGNAPSPEAYVVLGRIAAREGDWASAVVHWRNVVNAKPGDASAHLNYGNALEHMNDAIGADNEYAIFRSLSGMAPIPKDASKK